MITLVSALVLAGGSIGMLEAKLRPTVAVLAQVQVQNTIAEQLERAVTENLTENAVRYADLVSIQRDETGTITAMTTDMPALNLLRSELLSDLLAVLAEVDASDIQIPIGSLIDSELVWGRGPSLHARALSVGNVSAEWEGSFSSAGINQTLHRIWLELSLPVTVLLPGGWVEVPVETRLCVAETVIVGQVPDTYFHLGGSASSD
jgi:sporulation protein YunB